MAYVCFGDVCCNRVGFQAQYGVRYVDPKFSDEYSYLGKGLRFTGDFADYHSVEIHENDVEEFVERLTEVKRRMFG